MASITRRGFVAGAGVAAASLGMSGAAAFADEASASFDESYDVVVIGYGFAGAMSAISGG